MSWTIKTLGDVVDLKRGFDLPASQRVGGDFPIYSSSGLTGTHNDYAVKGPCVITGRYGTIGKVFYSSGDCWPLNTALYSCDFKGNNPRFIFYLLQIVPWREYATASAVPGINRNHVNTHEMAIPDSETQERIVSLLDSFTDKIALNNRINGYLGELARVEFSKRFGADVPTVELKEVLSISTKSLKPQDHSGETWEHYSIPSYDEGHGPTFELANEIKSNKYIVDKNSILISKLNPATKRIWMPACSSSCSVCSTEFIVYKPKNSLHKSFYYTAIDMPSFTSYLLAHTTGSTGSRQRAQPKATLAYPMPAPESEAISEFCAFADPIYKQIEVNEIESRQLTTLRNALLPKLMSGEIDVSQVNLKQLNSHLSGC